MAHPLLVPPEGVLQLDAVDAGPPPILRTEAGRLADLAAEFAMFTPGLLHTHGGLMVDPVGEFVARHPDRDCDVSRRDFGRVLFRGIARDASEEAWDRRLYFVGRRFWDELRASLSGIVLVDRARRTYAEARADLVLMPPEGDGRLPSFVTAFGVSGNRENVRIRTGPGGPAVVRMAVEPGVVARANAVFRTGPEALSPPRKS